MKCLTRRIELDTFSGKKIGIFAFYDIHLGSVACDEGKLRADIAGVKERGDWWIDGGDALESINRKDKRHKEDMMAPWLWGKPDVITPQVERYCELFEPIRSQCVLKLTGNHEDALLRHSERDVTYEMVRFIKAGIGNDAIQINGGARAFLRLMFVYRKRIDDTRPNSYRDYRTLLIMAGHGYGGGRMEGAGPLALGRLLKDNNADLALMGHRHHGAYVAQNQLDVNKQGNIINRKRYGYLVPSYRAGLLNERTDIDASLVDYADVQMFPSGTTGGVRIVYDVERGELQDPMRQW